MNTEAYGCGCFLKVHVCELHLEDAGVQLEAMRDQLALNLQYGVREGREASEDDLPF